MNRVPGRGWAYLGAVMGGAVSIAANIAHSFIPPHGTPTGWHPEPGAVIGAVVWPVFLFIAIEILVKPTWPHGTWWILTRWGGLLPVALVAAFVSYRHLSGLLAHYGEEPIVHTLGPLAVDGLMVMATGALIATTRHTPAPAPVTPSAPAAPAPEPAGHTATPQIAGSRPATVDTHTTRAHTLPDTPAPVPAHLVPTARYAVTNHHATTGRPITVQELSARISVPEQVAGQLLTLFDIPTESARINGTPLTGSIGDGGR